MTTALDFVISLFLLLFQFECTFAFCGGSFDVTNVLGITSYIFNLNGVDTPNPPINLTRGCSYTFSIGFGGSPFFIKDPVKTNPGATGNIGAYTDGVSSPGYPIIGVQNGALTWNLSLTTPQHLFYQCGSHSEMWGTINVLDPVCGPCDPVGSDGRCISTGQCRCYSTHTGENCSIALGQGCTEGNADSCFTCLNNSLPLSPLRMDFEGVPVWGSWELINLALMDLDYSGGYQVGPGDNALRIHSTGPADEGRGIRKLIIPWWTQEWILPASIDWWAKAESANDDCCYLSVDDFWRDRDNKLVYFDNNGFVYPTNFRYDAWTWYHLQITFNLMSNTYTVSINGILQKNGTTVRQWPLPMWNSTRYVYFGHDDPDTTSIIDDVTIKYGPACGCCANCWDTNPSYYHLECCPLGWTGTNCSYALGTGCATGTHYPNKTCTACLDSHAQPRPGGDCTCAPRFYLQNNTCTACNCGPPNSTATPCNDTTGQCECTNGHYGLRCNLDCGCKPGSSKNNTCDAVSGQCYCLPGYTGRNCSSDLNACQWFPCGLHATCSDLPPPALNNSLGRLCQCNSGYFDMGGVCTDINACQWWPCDAHETCSDLPPPGLNNTNGRICECQAGYEKIINSSACEDVNACIDYPCGLHMVCFDLPPPAPKSTNGRICNCDEGYTMGNSSICEEINACEWWLCGTDASCSDLPPPALNDTTGRVCTCNQGYQLEGVFCQNINACINFPCDVNATCIDYLPPATDNITGRWCNCTAGYTGSGEIGDCEDGNACLGFPCDSNATCKDLPPPALVNRSGRTCTCNSGFQGQGESGQCSAINACNVTPCVDNATCENLPLSQINVTHGRTCICETGKFFNQSNERCQDINACESFPCQDEHSTCYDLPAPQGNSTSGRQCSCNRGYALASNGICQDIDACKIYKCDGNATCVDLPPPALGDGDGRFCACNWGYTGNGTIGNCLQATKCVLGALPNVHGSVDCGNHSQCLFVPGKWRGDEIYNDIGAECVCDKGYVSDGTSCKASLDKGAARVHFAISRSYNVTTMGAYQSQFLASVVTESKGTYPQFRILQTLVQEEEKSVIEMDICEMEANNTVDNTTDPNAHPVTIIQRLQASITDSSSPLAQMGVTSIVPLDEPMAPPEPAPDRTRPPTSNHDVWELILAIVLAIIVVGIARALQLRYFNNGSSPTTTWSIVRPTDPD